MAIVVSLGERKSQGPLRGASWPSELRSGLIYSVPHTKSLESRIKEELIAQGLLEFEDRPRRTQRMRSLLSCTNSRLS